MTVTEDLLDHYPGEEFVSVRSIRDHLMMADGHLHDSLQDALGEKLARLGFPKIVTDVMVSTCCYGRDASNRAKLASLGLDGDIVDEIINETRGVAESDLRKELLTSGIGEDSINSILGYISTVQRFGHDPADSDGNDAWVRDQMLQLGAAWDNCPQEYLGAVIDAASFIIAHQPDPTSDIVHLYKRYPQNGHIHLRTVVEGLHAKGAKSNQVRAILNVHKYYGAQLGSAYMPLLQRAPELMGYAGGVLQLVADFADHKIPPPLQVGIVSQAGKEIGYEGGALELAMELAKRQVPLALQEALVTHCSRLKYYQNGVLQLADDLFTTEFPLAMEVHLVTQVANIPSPGTYPPRAYLFGLKRLYAVNAECVAAAFMDHSPSDRDCRLLVPEPKPELITLASATTAENLPHVASAKRVLLFSKLFAVLHFPRYPYYQQAAFDLASSPECVDMRKFELALDRLMSIAGTFENPCGESTPKGELPAPSLLVQDIVAIVQQQEYANVKGRWYDVLLHAGVDRDDIMTVVHVPLGTEWTNRDLTLRPCFQAIAERFFSGDAAQEARLLPIVALLLRDSYHYHLALKMCDEKQPNGVICRYVFGIGPEEQEGVTVTDIAHCEHVLERRQISVDKFGEYLQVAERVAVSFPVFGGGVKKVLEKEIKNVYTGTVGMLDYEQTPIELVVKYLECAPNSRCPELALVFARPKNHWGLSLLALEQLITMASAASASFPTQAEKIDAFVRQVFSCQSSRWEQSLSIGHTPSTLLAGVVADPTGRGLCIRTPDLAQLAKSLEALSVLAGPDALRILAPRQLTREAAVHISGASACKAGMLLGMLAESYPGQDGNNKSPEDDLAPAWRHVLQTRLERPGFPSMGAKVHVAKGVDLDLVNRLINSGVLGTSSFTTIHAGKTILLPPGQPIEIKIILNYLKSKGLFNDQDFDMQTCIGGRLRAEKHKGSIGILNAAMLLATQAMPSYPPDAWSTKSHDKVTNAYIMAYGAGQRNQGVPYDRFGPGDRTDMLGRRHLDDLDLYQIIATLIMHYEFDGYFADLGEIFVQKMVTLLQRYQLYAALFEAPWVFTPGVTSTCADSSTQKHWEMVQKFTAMRIVSEVEDDKGITGEVRDLVKTIYAKASTRFEAIKDRYPDEFGKLCSL